MFNEQLLEIATALNVKITFEPSWDQGSYDPKDDYININPFFNNKTKVLAHELIHASGHFQRLNRGIVGKVTKFAKEFPNDSLSGQISNDARALEEQIADYGALLLLRELNIVVPDIEESVANYLRRYGSVDGKPTQEVEENAKNAVNFLLGAVLQSRVKAA